MSMDIIVRFCMGLSASIFCFLACIIFAALLFDMTMGSVPNAKNSLYHRMLLWCINGLYCELHFKKTRKGE